MQVDMDDVDYISETTLTIRGTRRRTTVPKTVVERLCLDSGCRLRWMLYKDGKVLLVKVNGKG